MTIRPATPADVPMIAALYAHHVRHGTGTFEEVPPTEPDMAARLAAIVARGWPWLVAEQQGRVVGYAYAAQFRDRAAYRFTAEDSIYVAHDAVGRGVGAALLAALIPAAARAGFRLMVALIGDSTNAGSIAVHAGAGFRRVGLLEGAGFKFGRSIDVVLMQREIGEGG